MVEGVSQAAKSIQVGPGSGPQVQMGPLVSSTQFERVTGHIRTGRDEGARVAAGSGQVGSRGYFVEPTVLLDVNEGMRVVKEEIFGPVLVAQPVDDLEEIARAANTRRPATGLFLLHGQRRRCTSTPSRLSSTSSPGSGRIDVSRQRARSTRPSMQTSIIPLASGPLRCWATRPGTAAPKAPAAGPS